MVDKQKVRLKKTRIRLQIAWIRAKVIYCKCMLAFWTAVGGIVEKALGVRP